MIQDSRFCQLLKIAQVDLEQTSPGYGCLPLAQSFSIRDFFKLYTCCVNLLDSKECRSSSTEYGTLKPASSSRLCHFLSSLAWMSSMVLVKHLIMIRILQKNGEVILHKAG
jgi:hypothetical protein